MYVCICKGITERDIQQAVAEGCSSMRELKRELGVAMECGRCASCAKSVLHQACSSPVCNNAHSAALAAA